MTASLGAAVLVPLLASGDDRERRSLVERLSASQLAGQRVILSYDGLAPPERLFELIEEGKASGVIFFGANISSPEQLASVARQLQAARRRVDLPGAIRRWPLLLMTDQEGGLVRRLPGAPELSERQIGTSPHSRLLARRAGSGAGSNLRSAEINVNLAPVLGVLRPGADLNKFQRAYGFNPRKVSRLAAAFIEAQQRLDVAATAKHFPGLGAAEQNTDLTPVTFNMNLRRLRRKDEFPYRHAIEVGTALVMVNNATYTALDNRPAVFSRPVIQGELRRRLGFRGVTITDALEAQGLEQFGSVPHRAVLAARAGADLLLFSARSVDEGVGGYRAVRDTLRGGGMDRERFEASVARILDLRKRLSPGHSLTP